MRVAILGGGFNPPHKAHLFMVTDALASGKFDEVWVLPCWEHAFDKNDSLLPFETRMEMCRLAFSQWPNVIVRHYEKMYQTKYSIHLVTNLQRDYPDNDFTFIIGSDNVLEQHRWKDWNILENLIGLHVVPRERSSDSIWVWEMPNISSTRIRELIAAHETNMPYVEKMIPKNVFDYIVEKGLYL